MVKVNKLFLIFICWCFLRGGAYAETQQTTSYETLRIRYMLGENEAVQNILEHLQIYPEDVDVRLLLGQIYFWQNNFPMARLQALKVLRQVPEYSDASVLLANADIRQNELEQALEVIELALVFDPVNLDLLSKKTEILNLIYPVENPTQPQKIIQGKASQNPEYQRLNALYSSGAKKEAIRQAINYLNNHPQDGDVRLILGKFYFLQKGYSLARKELNLVLKATPEYVDARLILINIELIEHQYQKAFSLVKQGLKITPQNQDLQKKLKDVEYALKPRPKLPLASQETKPEQPVLPDYKNEIGVYQQDYYISDVKKIWNYSTFFYGRNTPIGKVYGKANYSARFSKEAWQGELEAYPRLGNFGYLDMDVAFADEPELFPDQTYALEAYVTAIKTWEFSLGGRYNKVDERHFFSAYTGSVSKYVENNRISLRTYYYVPGVGKNSNIYLLDLRHFFKEPNYFLGCLVGVGTSPDLADLTTVGFIVVKNRIISPYLGFALLNERLNVTLNLYSQHQEFPLQHIRDWSGGTLNLVWKF